MGDRGELATALANGLEQGEAMAEMVTQRSFMKSQNGEMAAQLTSLEQQLENQKLWQRFTTHLVMPAVT